MNLSKFERLVLEALIKGDPEEDKIRSQLHHATVKARDYTGVGLFAEIRVNPDRQRLRMSHRLIAETPAVLLEHPELQGGAGALLWLKDGYVATLECYVYVGNWPVDESLFTIKAYPKD